LSAYSKRKVFISIFKYSSKRLSIVCKDGASWISKNVSKSFIKTAKRKGISFPLDEPYTATEKIRIYTFFCYTEFNILVHTFNYIETFSIHTIFFIIFVHSPLLLTLANALLKSTNVQNSIFYAENISQ
jgi:hypothetical protein